MSKHNNVSMDHVKEAFLGREPWFNVFVLKSLTVPAVWLIVNYTRITPNILTLMSLLSGAAAGYMFFLGDVEVGSGLYLGSYFFDALDGKVARLRGGGSVYGAWLDIAVDRLVFFFVVLGLGWSQLSVTEGYVVTSMLIFVFLFGFESRYNIQINDVQQLVRLEDWGRLKIWHPVKKTEEVHSSSPYQVWLKKYGLVTSPITLVEVLIFLFAVSPVLDVYFEASLVAIVFLVIRLINQQRFWLR